MAPELHTIEAAIQNCWLKISMISENLWYSISYKSVGTLLPYMELLSPQFVGAPNLLEGFIMRRGVNNAVALFPKLMSCERWIHNKLCYKGDWLTVFRQPHYYLALLSLHYTQLIWKMYYGYDIRYQAALLKIYCDGILWNRLHTHRPMPVTANKDHVQKLSTNEII